MKKVLFASTALVAAGLMSTGSASAAEKIKLQLGGFSQWWVVGAWNDDSFQANNNAANTQGTYNNVDVKGNNEIYFDGTTTLDNGLKVGVHVELEAGGNTDQTTDTIDVSYAFVEGGFGKLSIGSQFSNAWLLHVAAPDAAGNAGPEGIITSGVSVAKPTAVTPVGFTGSPTTANTGSAGGLFTGIFTDEKAERLSYTAPAFAGLTAGVSYTPSIKVGDQDNRAMPTAGGGEAWNGGLMYANTFGGVGVKVSATAMTYDSGNQYDRTFEQAYGTQISYAGFTVGGSWKQVKDNLTGAGTVAGNTGAAPTTSGAGNIWDAGIMYATGPYAVSFYYIKGEAEGAINQTAGSTTGKDKSEVYQVSGKYTMGPGVDLLATVGHAKWDDGDSSGTAAAPNNNEGWVVTTGLSLTF